MINYFTSKYPPRPLQEDVLSQVDKAWNSSDIIVIRASVGAGKTAIAECISKYVAEKEGREVTLCVPTNVLVKQVLGECPDFTTSTRKHAGHSERTWEDEKQRLRRAPMKVMNYYSYLAHRAYTPVVIWDECFTPDMEVLTSDGFKRFDELDRSELIAQFNSDTTSISFVTPSRYIEKHVTDHNMISISSDKKINVTATENHDFLVENKHGVLSKERLKDVKWNHNYRLYKAGCASGTDKTLTSIEKLLIMYQADGSEYTKNHMTFSFSKERKIDAFLKLMKSGRFTWHEVKGTPTKGNVKARRRFVVECRESFSKTLTDHFTISSMHVDKCKAIIEYMVGWDGHDSGDGRFYYSCIDKENVDFYQCVALLANYNTNVSIQVDNRKDTYNDIHRLYIRKNSNTVTCQKVKREESKYTGNVYCVTVPDGNIIVRRNGKPVVVGNCQAIAPMLIELESMKLWHHTYHYPPHIRSTMELLVWASSQCFANDKKIQKLVAALLAHPTLYTFDIAMEEWRGEMRQRLKVWPLSPSTSKPILWPPSRVKKMVLMSATISEEDIADLGLDKRRVTLIDGGSAIPPNRRPIFYSPVGNMSARSQDGNISKAVDRITKMMYSKPNEKGLIHLTYALSRKLRKTSLYNDDRIVWHGVDNKSQRLQEWFDAPPESGKVLMACGLTEGLDVKGDLGRWQAILKMPFLNKSDVAVAAKLDIRPQWYNWQCIKDVEQATGRICRGPDDYGETYILDEAFARLFNNNKHLFSESFKSALV